MVLIAPIHDRPKAPVVRESLAGERPARHLGIGLAQHAANKGALLGGPRGVAAKGRLIPPELRLQPIDMVVVAQGPADV